MIDITIKGDILIDPKKLKKEIKKLEQILKQLKMITEDKEFFKSYGGTDPE